MMRDQTSILISTETSARLFMGGFPNHRFSVEKNREVSRLESGAVSLRRLLRRAARGERVGEQNVSPVCEHLPFPIL